MLGDSEFMTFPILMEYEFHKVFSAKKIWLLLSEWLGKEKELKNHQTDKEKIIAYGFELKSSFSKVN